MGQPIQEKVQQILQHTDEAIGYSVATGVGSAPIWVNTLTGYLELIAVFVAIGVGISTWRLNRAKRNKIEKSD